MMAKFCNLEARYSNNMPNFWRPFCPNQPFHLHVSISKALISFATIGDFNNL